MPVDSQPGRLTEKGSDRSSSTEEGHPGDTPPPLEHGVHMHISQDFCKSGAGRRNQTHIIKFCPLTAHLFLGPG